MKKINILTLSSLALTSLPVLMSTISCNANTASSNVESTVPSEKPNNPESPSTPTTPEVTTPTPDLVVPEKFSNEDEFLGELIDRYYKSLAFDYVRDTRVPVISLNGNVYRVTLVTNTGNYIERDEIIDEEKIKELFPNGYEII